MPKKSTAKSLRQDNRGGILWPLLLGCGALTILFTLIACLGIGWFGYFEYFVGVNINEAGFNRLQQNMTEEQVQAILGKPKRSVPEFWNGVSPKYIVDDWSKGGNQISVRFADGHASHLTGTFTQNGVVSTRQIGAPPPKSP